MLKISEGANPNYLAKIVELKDVRQHSNADRLKVVTIDFQNVITGPDAKDGDVYVFFPLECQINFEFLKKTNSFSSQLMNEDTSAKGYFDKNGRVRAVKLRGEKSMGYIAPLHVIEHFTGKSLIEHIGEEFDTIGDILMCRKYVIKSKEPNQRALGKKPRISRLVDGQVRLHVDTENLRRNAFLIKPEDYISLTYKTHGTSWWVSNILVKRKMNFLLKFLGKFIRLQDMEYDYVYGSRKVVKNEYETQGTQHFYDSDIWAEIKEKVKEFLPKGYTFYGECLGYTSGGAWIQKDYDYGCEQGQQRIQIYRITFTNADGIVCDLSTQQVKEFCDRFGLEYVHLFYFGQAKDLFPELDTENHWNEEFVKKLEATYTEKKCFMCKNDVWEEGIVLRKESLFSFESYKLKSFAFLQMETERLDNEEVDIESEN